MDTVELMRTPTPRNQGELAWRFGLMLAAVNLSLLAIGLAHVNTRRPSNLNLVVALVGSLAYFNSINLTQNWVANGRFGMAQALLTLHGGMFLVALALMWWRDHAAVLQFRRGAPRAVPA
jgi:lipopolysaccharide export system permease protein